MRLTIESTMDAFDDSPECAKRKVSVTIDSDELDMDDMMDEFARLLHAYGYANYTLSYEAVDG